MSRIHEALKKAEQERAATQGGTESGYGTSQAVATPDPLLDAQAGVGTDMLPPIGAPATAGAPAFGNALSVDNLLARSVPMEWRPEPGTMLFMNGDDNVRGAEEFRTLRSRLYHMRERMPLRKILVTSALPKEGKSFTAANLAQVIVRQHGRRVLLVDADLRSPRLHHMFGTTAHPGLADYLTGRSDEFSIMQRGSLENLFFIPSGSDIGNPAELVGNGRL